MSMSAYDDYITDHKNYSERRRHSRISRAHAEGVYKNKREIEKYKKIADRVLKESKVYEKETSITICCIIIIVIMLAITPFVILYKNKSKKTSNVISEEPITNNVSNTSSSNILNNDPISDIKSDLNKYNNRFNDVV